MDEDELIEAIQAVTERQYTEDQLELVIDAAASYLSCLT